MLSNAWHLEIDRAQARQAAAAGAAGARRLQEAEQAFNVVNFLSMKNVDIGEKTKKSFA